MCSQSTNTSEVVPPASLAGASVGDTMHLRCGGRVIITEILSTPHHVKAGCWWWYSDGSKIAGSTCDPFDCIKLDKIPTIEDEYVNLYHKFKSILGVPDTTPTPSLFELFKLAYKEYIDASVNNAAKPMLLEMSILLDRIVNKELKFRG